MDKRIQLATDMFDRHGPIIGNTTLARALGFANLAALRQARRRGHIDLHIFKISGRRGFFALTADVVEWLQAAAADNCCSAQEQGPFQNHPNFADEGKA